PGQGAASLPLAKPYNILLEEENKLQAIAQWTPLLNLLDFLAEQVLSVQLQPPLGGVQNPLGKKEWVGHLLPGQAAQTLSCSCGEGHIVTLRSFQNLLGHCHGLPCEQRVFFCNGINILYKNGNSCIKMKYCTDSVCLAGLDRAVQSPHISISLPLNFFEPTYNVTVFLRDSSLIPPFALIEEFSKAPGLSLNLNKCKLMAIKNNTDPNKCGITIGGLRFILMCNYNVVKSPSNCRFHKEVLLAWSLAYKNNFSPSKYVIWNDRDILYEHNSLFLESWVKNDVLLLKQHFNSGGHLISSDEFLTKYKTPVTPKEFAIVFDATPSGVIMLLKN
ncbi:hypothetical protein Z043_122414, partial [Scleropages formosus]